MTAPAPHGGQTNRERAAEDDFRALADALVQEVPHSAGCVAHGGPCLCSRLRAKRAIALAVTAMPVVLAAEARGDATGYERGRTEAAAKIGGIHFEVSPGWCDNCGFGWPCPTARLAAELSVPGLPPHRWPLDEEGRKALAADLSVPGSQELQP